MDNYYGGEMDVYIITFSEDMEVVITNDPQYTIGQLIQDGASYDTMRLFKGREIDFDILMPNIEVKIKE